ncbi:hypothetical protein Lal_00047321 [Lupinus albus]|uniref:Uncharacterized protein n=1 Tax=Lupinus albus TaxID=3870 RepID=A0A6A4QX07_LUPAL|nr:hypothetical protein Lalb_Chr02g0141781 [Lupinus albus]KAF1878650.1 hypothetical protein Lal_00047321 [Lupinus albus]
MHANRRTGSINNHHINVFHVSMLQSLRNEATKSEDTFMQLQEIQESVRLASLNCFLDFAESIPLEAVPEPPKSAYTPFRNSMDSPSKNNRGTYNSGSSNLSRHRH